MLEVIVFDVLRQETFVRLRKMVMFAANLFFNRIIMINISSILHLLTCNWLVEFFICWANCLVGLLGNACQNPEQRASAICLYHISPCVVIPPVHGRDRWAYTVPDAGRLG